MCRTGAVDYISKPFQFQEIHACVEAHLKLHTLQRALKRQNEHLEEAVGVRTRELAEANRELAEANSRLAVLDRSKNEFLHLISHEFRTPLNGLLGVGELILDEMALTDESAELRKLFSKSRRRILSLLDDALLLTQIGVSGKQFKPALVSVHARPERKVPFAKLLSRNRRHGKVLGAGGECGCLKTAWPGPFAYSDVTGIGRRPYTVT